MMQTNAGAIKMKIKTIFCFRLRTLYFEKWHGAVSA
jgi:hypothetical protein